MRIFQIQRLSAVALLVFLTIHMVVVHYPPFHIDFSRIIERMAHPLWKGIDIAFLFFVLLHALVAVVTRNWQVVARVAGIMTIEEEIEEETHGVEVVLGPGKGER